MSIIIHCENFIEITMEKLDKLEIGQCLDIRSFKRNRKVVIVRTFHGYNLYEDGFETNEFLDLTDEKLRKLLKTIEKREFPRSNRLRFYTLNSREDSLSRANYREEYQPEEEVEEDTSFLVRINCDYGYYDLVKNLIEKGEGFIEKADFTNSVYLIVRLEEELYQQLLTHFYIRMHKM